MVELEEQADATKAKMATLEERAICWEVQLGRAKGDLAEKTELFKKAEAELLEDATDAYGGGFEDALAQVAYVNSELDLTPFTVLKRVVDGQFVPIAPPF